MKKNPFPKLSGCLGALLLLTAVSWGQQPVANSDKTDWNQRLSNIDTSRPIRLDTLLSVICSNGKKSLPLVKEVMADEEGQMERRVVVPPALTLKTAAAILNENGFDCSVVDGVVLVRSQYLVKRGQSCFDIALKGFEDRGNIRELLNKLMTACDKSGVSVAVGFGTRTKFDQQQHVLSTPENGTIGDVLLQLSKTGGPGLSLVVLHPKTASSKAEVFLSLP